MQRLQICHEKLLDAGRWSREKLVLHRTPSKLIGNHRDIRSSHSTYRLPATGAVTVSESDERRPHLKSHRFAKTTSSEHWIGHRSLLLATAVCRVWLSGFVGPECIWIYRSSQGSSQVFQPIVPTARSDRWTFAASALPGKVLGATESDIVGQVTRVRLHAPARS